MIALVDITGVYKFGFGSRSAAIGSLTRGASTIYLSKIGSTVATYVVGLRFEHSFVKTATVNTSYSIVTKNSFTSLKPVTVFNNDAKTKIYNYAGLRIAKIGNIESRYSQIIRYGYSFVKTATVNTSYSIVTKNSFTSLKPVTVFNNDAKTKIYNYAGLITPKIISILNKTVLRFDVGFISSPPKINTIKFYLNTNLFKTTSIVRKPLISFKKHPYVFGDNPSMDILRSNFYGMQLPKLVAVSYTTVNQQLDKIAFSYCETASVSTVKFYLDTNLFKTSSIVRPKLFTFKSYKEIFTGITSISSPLIYSVSDSNYTTIYNLGSGIVLSPILTATVKDLISDYSITPFSGMVIVNIFSAKPISWQQTTGSETTAPPISTEILIQFWS